jgi:hypothetical protein
MCYQLDSQLPRIQIFHYKLMCNLYACKYINAFSFHISLSVLHKHRADKWALLSHEAVFHLTFQSFLPNGTTTVYGCSSVRRVSCLMFTQLLELLCPPGSPSEGSMQFRFNKAGNRPILTEHQRFKHVQISYIDLYR